VTRARRAWLLAGALCAAVIVADQVAKAIVRAEIVIGEEIDVFGPLGLTHTRNTGVAFGLAGGTGAPLVIVMLIALGVVAYLFAQDPRRPGMWVASGLLAGGAVGNLIDRIRHGHVVDFLLFHAFGRHWPAFNVADSAIVCGAALLILDELLRVRRS